MELSETDQEVIELRKRLAAIELFIMLQVKRWPWQKPVFEPREFEH